MDNNKPLNNNVIKEIALNKYKYRHDEKIFNDTGSF